MNQTLPRAVVIVSTTADGLSSVLTWPKPGGL